MTAKLHNVDVFFMQKCKISRSLIRYAKKQLRIGERGVRHEKNPNLIRIDIFGKQLNTAYFLSVKVK
jgi:hypothetical protein